MTYIIIGIICFILFAMGMAFYYRNIISSLVRIIVFGLVLLITTSLTVWFDYMNQTNDTEIWSGKIIKVEHIEEYDEWHEPRIETYTTTDSKGNVTTHTRTIPGYWEHHYAENYIETTDNGRIRISNTPDGRKLSDIFVNSNEELEEHYPIGSPTASLHTYENKLKASYSILKHKEIDLEKYSDLPEYPSKVNARYSVNRLIGEFKNSEELNKQLDNINTRLNDTNNLNNIESVKSYKQVNLMLVNLGDKSEDYGWVLQDYWKNGAKNDFVVTFGVDNKGNVAWCHPFSWTDVEILKSDVREYMIGKNINNFSEVLNEISDLVEEKFDRKQFAEFNYIQIDVTNTAKRIIGILVIIHCIGYFLICKEL